VDVGVAVGVPVAVAVGVGVAQALISVVQVPPAEGQQYFVVAVPQVSTRPARLQRLSFAVPSESGGWQLLRRVPLHCSEQVAAAFS